MATHRYPRVRRFPRVRPGEFRNKLGDYLIQIAVARSNFVLSKHGKRMCVFTPIEPGARGEKITPGQYRRRSAEFIARVCWAKERFLIVKRNRKLAWMRPVEDIDGMEPKAPRLRS
jgi:hypothetical protein